MSPGLAGKFFTNSVPKIWWWSPWRGALRPNFIMSCGCESHHVTPWSVHRPGFQDLQREVQSPAPPLRATSGVSPPGLSALSLTIFLVLSCSSRSELFFWPPACWGLMTHREIHIYLGCTVWLLKSVQCNCLIRVYNVITAIKLIYPSPYIVTILSVLREGVRT